MEVPRPYAVYNTKQVKVNVDKPVLVKVPVHVKVPVPQPYNVDVPVPVAVRVPQPVVVKVPQVYHTSSREQTGSAGIVYGSGFNGGTKN